MPSLLIGVRGSSDSQCFLVDGNCSSIKTSVSRFENIQDIRNVQEDFP